MTESETSFNAIEVFRRLKFGSKAAKYEIMAQMFMECDEDFVKMFKEKAGEDKFNELVAHC